MSISLLKRLRIMSAVLISTACVAQAAEFYVSPAGSASGQGTINSPWDLQTALSHPSAVKPGDTIWLRGGTYRGNYTSNLNGAAGAPIIVRQYRGERASIDGGSSRSAALTANGSWTWYWGFEIFFSDTKRSIQSSGSWPSDLQRGDGIVTSAPNTKFINLVVHDTAQGISFWTGAVNSELYGNLIYYNGWEAPDRGHGHSVYSQNDTGTKRIVDNIMFSSYSFGLHVYGSSAARLNNYHVEGNTAFNHGVLSLTGRKADIYIGGGAVAQNPTVLNNFAYGSGGRAVDMAAGAGCNSPAINNNYLVAKGGSSLLINCTNVRSLTGNTLYGGTSFSSSQYPSNTYGSAGTGVKTFVRPNQYERGRANITVYNWSRQSSVSVDLSAAGLSAGAPFEIRDAQNFYSSPIVYGTYSGAPVSIPMTGLVATPVIGNTPVPALHTATEFGVFVVIPLATGPSAVNHAPLVSAGGNQSVTLPASATLNGTASDDGLPSGTLSTIWAQVSGPGTTMFGNVNARQTTANFSAAGTYKLRLTASDGSLSSSSEITVTVSAAGSFPGIRVNAGGSAVTDSAGRTWSADNGFDRGLSYGSSGGVTGTTSSVLYQDVHYDGAGFRYRFAVPNGVYTVNLKFAEIYFDKTGQRVFNVNLNGQRVLSNFDIIAAASGPFKAIDRSFPVTVGGGEVILDFGSVVQAPVVGAIEIVQQSAAGSTVSVACTPASVTLSANQTQQFSATVTDSSNTAVVWSLTPAVGTITTTGAYKAPSAITSSQTVLVKATSVADPTKSASATVTLAGTTSGPSPIRINAGGTAHTDGTGKVWSADSGFDKGMVYSANASFSGTTTPQLYRDVRYDFGTLQYQFSVPNASYVVNLKFAEPYFSQPGQRVFHVVINGQQVLTNFDIVAAAPGAFKALDKSFPVVVSNGKLTIQFVSVINAGMINALEILPAL